jgi:uncharacterized protein
MFQFDGMRSLVTGASSGIGEVFARELAARRSDLVLAARTQEKLESLAAELRSSAGVAVQVIAIDLAEPGAGRRLADQLRRSGLQIDVLINNAGFGLHAPMREADPDRLSQQVQLNVAALTDLTAALLPGMLERDRGAIVNVASTAAFQPVPYMAVYGATKAYVLSFSEALWAETRSTNVRVTALCPGATDTSFFAVAGEDAQVGRRMTPEQVVAAAFRALERRRPSVVTGLQNRMVANSGRLAPRAMVARIAERTMRPPALPSARSGG